LKRIHTWLAGACAASLLLTGCGGSLEEPYALAARTGERIAAVSADERRAEPMAQDLCVITGSEPAPDASVTAKAAAVFSLEDHQVLVQRNPFERLYPASITKVMTALVALRYGNLSDTVTVGPEVLITEPGSSMCGIKPGDSLTLEQLLYGLMLPSGNDAGAAIAVHIAGSEEAFCELMNSTAHALGATDTHFANAHGLHDEAHYTTAYDLYLIFQEALTEPVFRDVINSVTYTAEYTDAAGSAVSKTWKNSNKFLLGEREAPDGLHVIGGKTGTTSKAGYCLILASSGSGGQEYISVVLKSDSREHLYDGMTNILHNIRN